MKWCCLFNASLCCFVLSRLKWPRCQRTSLWFDSWWSTVAVNPRGRQWANGFVPVTYLYNYSLSSFSLSLSAFPPEGWRRSLRHAWISWTKLWTWVTQSHINCSHSGGFWLRVVVWTEVVQARNDDDDDDDDVSQHTKCVSKISCYW